MGVVAVLGASTLVVAGAPAVAEVPPPVQASIDSVITEPRFQNSTWGMQVLDAQTGEVVYSSNANQMFVPAAVVKSFAGVTALASLGDDHRFVTPVHRVGSVDGGTLDGDLVLVASGDFSFGLRDQGTELATTDVDHSDANTRNDATLVNGDPLAALDELAQEVKKSGIDSVGGDVIVDDRLFESYGGWPDGLVSPVWVNENVVDVTTTPTDPGEQAEVAAVPQTASYKIVNKATTGDDGSAPTVKVEQTAPGVLTVSGAVPADHDPIVRVFQVTDPSAFARTAFIQALERADVSVDAGTTGTNPAGSLPKSSQYPKKTQVAEHTSPPLSEYVKVILKGGANRAADLMVCLAAVEAGETTCPAGMPILVKTIQGLGAAPGTTFVFDPAGSDERDRSTPASMATFLRSVSFEVYGEGVRDAMSGLGVDGSLATTLERSPASGNVVATIGSLANETQAGQGLLAAQTASGYLTSASGRELVFAIYVNDVPVDGPADVAAVRAAVARLMEIFQQGL
jgi:D-alanyl-D-alanine carboxypeptidase/D-alanyl-D-alanine-endopeptidase (penicillin-binding protein 4)